MNALIHTAHVNDGYSNGGVRKAVFVSLTDVLADKASKSGEMIDLAA